MIDFCVLGSGLSGSTIANLLNKKYSIQIIEKAKGIGGRSSNKKIGKSISFDHGLQYYSAKDIKFKKFLNKFIKKRILKYWLGNHIDLKFEKNLYSKKIIGVKGNNDLNKYLLKNINKILGEEISNIKFKKSHWEISSKNNKFKAKNIILTFPFEQVKKLAKNYLNKELLNLKVNMKPNITLLLKQKTKSELPISSIKLNNKIIAWVANENSKKRFLSYKNCWTIQTTESYSKKIISLYKKKKTYFAKQIAKEFSNILGLNYKSLEILKIHGWKYSFNLYGTGKKCYWNKKQRIGVCGDWFIGPNAYSAWLSANSLYKKIKKNPPK